MDQYSEEDHEHIRALIQWRRDYLAIGKIGGFVLAVSKWILGISATIIIAQTGLKAFVGV